MKITPETLHKIAHLARLDVRPEEEAPLVESLNGVLTWMEQLNEVDTAGVAPLTHISEELNVLRDDRPGEHLPTDRALHNAPAGDEAYFRVPKVIE